VTARGPRIIDCTLREGAQAPEVSFTAEQTEEVVGLLVAAGVDMIECGHAAVSAEERTRIKAAVAAAGEVPVLVHARACRPDIDAVVATGASWVGLFLGVNEHTRRSRIVGASVEDLLGMLTDAVGYAVGRGLRVRMTVEDASRTEPELLERAYEAGLAAGASRICFADTVGALEPGEVGATVRRLRERFPAAEVEAHMHDDRGLAMANALAAVDAGARWVSCSVNGLGERSGITDLFVMLANLHARGTRPLGAVGPLRRAGEVVAAFSRSPVDPRRPVTGRHAFVHTSRLHKRAVEIDPMAYSWIEPAELGAEIGYGAARRWTLTDLAVEPEIRSATELAHHRHGPGDRYLLVDDRKLDGCGQYCIARHIPEGTHLGPGHVDVHRHGVDSLFVFLGSREGLAGLRAEVTVGDEQLVVDSPHSVFVPAGSRHSYRVVSGAGLFLNFVLAGSYPESLLE
jgi:2-isopropylmalate synthase